jgi:hypothetical protein
MPLAERDREAVKRRAGYRCEYCHIVGWELQVDHILPRSSRRRDLSSTTDEEPDAPENLAAACAHCNRFKGDFTTGLDPLTGREARLFHPRRDIWDEHFDWSVDYQRLLPLSEVGGATIARLRMNDVALRRQRRLLRGATAGGEGPWP